MGREGGDRMNAHRSFIGDSPLWSSTVLPNLMGSCRISIMDKELERLVSASAHGLDDCRERSAQGGGDGR